MRRRYLLLIALVWASAAYCQERVFVDLKQLASLHPAWSMARRMERGQKKPLTKFTFPPLTFTEVLTPSLPIVSLAEWVTEQQRVWEREIDLLRRRQLQAEIWQLPLTVSPSSFADPIARWKFVIRQREKQAAERVRLNLRLAFSDLLSDEEKAALEQRQRELDAALEPPPLTLPPLPPPVTLPQKFDLTVPQSLTDPQTILILVSPEPCYPLQQTLVIPTEVGEITLKLLATNAEETLCSIAREVARTFVLAYARQRGWKVTFDKKANAPDVTEEVLTAWERWLEGTKPKE